MFGMAPAQQRLHADDLAVGGCDDGLVEYIELVALDRFAEILRQAGASEPGPKYQR